MPITTVLPVFHVASRKEAALGAEIYEVLDGAMLVARHAAWGGEVVEDVSVVKVEVELDSVDSVDELLVDELDSVDDVEVVVGTTEDEVILV